MSASANEEKAASMMTLTDEEVRWTQAVKEAAAEDESLNKLSDYEYAHHTLFQNGDVEKTLFQMEGMQHFREEYKITDTVEEGMELIRQLHEQQPWVLLDVGCEDYRFVLVIDYAQLKPSTLRLPEDWRAFLGGFYYVFQMVTSNLYAVREGIIFLGEIEGMGWHNMSIDFWRTFWDHFFRFYPMKFQETSLVHNSVIGNILESIGRSIMNERDHNIRIGAVIEPLDGRLDAIFQVPTPEIAFDRLMEKCKTLLTKRFQHYQTYQLPTGTAPTEDILAREATEEDILFREAMEAGDGEENSGGEGSDDDDDEACSEDEPPEETRNNVE